MLSADGHGFGWIPNREGADRVAFAYHPTAVVGALPPRVYLNTPKSLDQGSIGSCTAHGAGMAVAILELARGAQIWLSRLMVYRGARKRLGPQYVEQDSGAMPDDALDAIRDGEAAPESLWPYDVTRFRDPPSPEAVAVAKPHTVEFRPLAGDVVHEAKAALAAGFPVNLGFQIRTDRRGGLQVDHVGADGLYPWDTTQPLARAGHDVLLVGYGSDAREFLAVNSWGSAWGCELPGQPERGRGCFRIPEAMFASSDVADRSAVVDWE